MSDDPVTALLALETEARAKLHDGQASQRKLTPDYEVIGLSGEVEFGRAFRQPVNWNRTNGGDDGIDFIVPLAFTVDVKCSASAGHLLVEQGKVVADIYVLAEFSGLLGRAELVGWEYGSVVAKAPAKDWGAGVVNHYIPREALRPMADLRRRAMLLRTGGGQ